MTAARLIQEYPEVVEPLRDGRLCLSTVAEVSNVVTRENVASVLPPRGARSVVGTALDVGRSLYLTDRDIYS